MEDGRHLAAIVLELGQRAVQASMGALQRVPKGSDLGWRLTGEQAQAVLAHLVSFERPHRPGSSRAVRSSPTLSSASRPAQPTARPARSHPRRAWRARRSALSSQDVSHGVIIPGRFGAPSVFKLQALARLPAAVGDASLARTRTQIGSADPRSMACQLAACR
jgi:hypothetical protein